MTTSIKHAGIRLLRRFFQTYWKVVQISHEERPSAPASNTTTKASPAPTIPRRPYEQFEERKPFTATVEALEQLKGIHKGERCFIVGNGPSLNEMDLSLLADEISIGVNGIFYKTRETGFSPTYYVVEDNSVMAENLDDIIKVKARAKFFPTDYQHMHPAGGNVHFFNMNRGFYEQRSPYFGIPRFSTDFPKVAYCGQSVTYINLQLAYHMGFDEIYMVGMDFSYVIPESHDKKGVIIVSTTDDPNHFHKDYFGKGKTYKDPQLDRVLMNYKMAKFVYECAGRKIYNATAGGKLELFPRVEFTSLF